MGDASLVQLYLNCKKNAEKLNLHLYCHFGSNFILQKDEKELFATDSIERMLGFILGLKFQSVQED